MGKKLHKVLCQIGLELVSMAKESSHKVITGKMLWPLYTLIYDWIFIILAGNEDNHEISDEFEIRPDRTTDCIVSCAVSFPSSSGNIPIDL